MAFDSIDNDEFAVGKPISFNTQAKIKENFDDHETRIEELEVRVGDPPIILGASGRYPVRDAVLSTVIAFNMTVLGVRLLIDQAGTLGTTSIDIKRKRGNGNFETILSGYASAAYSSGDDFFSPNAINLDRARLLAGDELRLDIVSAQMGASGFLVRIDYQRK